MTHWTVHDSLDGTRLTGRYMTHRVVVVDPFVCVALHKLAINKQLHRGLGGCVREGMCVCGSVRVCGVVVCV